jgi:DNA-binding transcriptional LysR family regulator
MIKDLNRMAVFAKVVEEGSFSAAADALGLGKSVVSIHVSQLEKNLRCQLLTRTTRKLVLTAEGRAFYERCKQLVDVADAARHELETGLAEPAGLVRISSSIGFGEIVLSKLIPKFRLAYPDVQIEFILDNKFVDLNDENFDLAIRIGEFDGANMRMTKIGDTKVPLCASRELAKELSVETPEDLTNQTWITVTQWISAGRVHLRHPSGEEKTIAFADVLKTNGGGVAKSLILNGAGIGPLPDYVIVDELKSGRLVKLLPDWEFERQRPISLVFPNRLRVPAKTRALIDFIKAHVKDHLPEGNQAPQPVE